MAPPGALSSAYRTVEISASPKLRSVVRAINTYYTLHVEVGGPAVGCRPSRDRLNRMTA